MYDALYILTGHFFYIDMNVHVRIVGDNYLSIYTALFSKKKQVTVKKFPSRGSWGE